MDTTYDRYMVGQGVPFERIRRITGYLSKLEHFNSAKQAEERDRVTHDVDHCTDET